LLKQIMSPVFIDHGVHRPPIVFHRGLNVILGTPDGINSIGKSSALQAIDFMFGGDTYVKGAWDKHVGDHTVYCTFEFKGKDYSFARNTKSSDEIQLCLNDYSLTGEKWEKNRYVAWLAEMYGIDYPGISFRQEVSGFFRIHQKGNTNYEQPPLFGIRGDSKEKSLNRLVKLFNRYGEIESYNVKLNEQKEKLSIYRAARKHQFVSDLIGGDKQYEANLSKIHELQTELDNLTTEQAEGHSEEDIEKSQKKDELRGRRLRIESLIESKKRRMKLLDMSLEYGLYPTEADLDSLQEYFPDVNIRKIYEVENYHRKLALILDDQFQSEKNAVQLEIDELEEQRREINKEISNLGFVGNISKEFLDKHSELKAQIAALTEQNKAYLTLKDLQDAKALAADKLKNAIEQILRDIEHALNDRMEEYTKEIYGGPHSSPTLTINGYNSYTFETKGDTGSAAGYKGMILYDLAVLNSTGLPAIAHDSILFGDLGYDMVEGIMKLYEQHSGTKQIFIAFEKLDAYTTETQRIVDSNAVLRLKDGEGKLYGKSWNTEGEK
jgi:hypothetical protein